MYRASLRLAEQSYANGAGVNPTGVSKEVKEFFVGAQDQDTPTPSPQPPPSPQNQNPADKNTSLKKDGGSQKQQGAKGNVQHNR